MPSSHQVPDSIANLIAIPLYGKAWYFVMYERLLIYQPHFFRATGNHEDQQQLDITSGLDFTSLHSSEDGLDSLTAVATTTTTNGEETRGPRAKNPEPGRTYECEIWCRDASRQLASCLGFTVLVFAYAVSINLKETVKLS